jgi:4,5-DOPA dioxygenase extradiol
VTVFPSLFVTHGAPTLAIEDGAAHRFLKGYGTSLGRPEAILVVSAHWEAAVASLTAGPRPETIHDFRGFPPALGEIVYPAPGAPELAERVGRLLDEAGIQTELDRDRGLDHGAWVPLFLMYPRADIPVVQLSIDPARGPEYHRMLGELIRPLRDEGVLVMATGSATHNLLELRWGDHDAPAPAWVTAFAEWVAAAIAESRTDDLLNYRTLAPNAVRNHPTEEHFLPVFTAIGASRPGAGGHRVHHSYTYGVLAMDTYAIG